MKFYDAKNMYKRWNYTTACCYIHHTKCEYCPNEIVCSKARRLTNGMHPIKYAVMRTLANIGLEGMQQALKENAILKELCDDDTRNE